MSLKSLFAYPFAALAVVCALGTAPISGCGSSEEQTKEQSAPASGRASSSKQNVLLVILDDVGVPDVGAYRASGSNSATPSIDALASRGVKFQNAWANPACSPTRASVYTGRHAYRHGVGNAIADPDDGALKDSETTIAEILRDGGYSVGLFGKWHLGNNEDQGGNCAPLQVGGFDIMQGTLHGEPISYYDDSDFESDYYDWLKVDSAARADCSEASTGGQDGDPGTYATNVNFEDASAWIQAQIDAGKPWFASVAFNAAHHPYHVPPEGQYTTDLSGVDCDSTKGDRKCYVAMIEAMDQKIGELLEAVPDDTLVIVLGDNGTPGEVVAPGQNPRKAKATPYEGGVRVPLIIAGSGVQRGRTATKGLVNALDLFTTIADAAGIDVRKALPEGTEIDSKSLWRYLRRPQASSAKEMIYTEAFDTDPCWKLAAVRNSEFKLIVQFSGREELYNLSEDSGETSNLLRQSELSEEEQEAYDELKQEYERIQSEARAIGASDCSE